jgi:hypothetical protein
MVSGEEVPADGQAATQVKLTNPVRRPNAEPVQQLGCVHGSSERSPQHRPRGNLYQAGYDESVRSCLVERRDFSFLSLSPGQVSGSFD